jgi:hypothetical protein
MERPMPSLRKNYYGGRCCRCDAWVCPGAGTLTADGDLQCAAHSPESARKLERPQMAAELARRHVERVRRRRTSQAKKAARRSAQLALFGARKKKGDAT